MAAAVRTDVIGCVEYMEPLELRTRTVPGLDGRLAVLFGRGPLLARICDGHSQELGRVGLGATGARRAPRTRIDAQLALGKNARSAGRESRGKPRHGVGQFGAGEIALPMTL